jgi:hypothetical protein
MSFTNCCFVHQVVNDPTEMRKLVELGVDGIFTDRPDLAIQIWNEMGLKSHTIDPAVKFYKPKLIELEQFECSTWDCIAVSTVVENLVTVLALAVIVVTLGCSRKWSNKEKQQRLQQQEQPQPQQQEQRSK